MVLALLAGLAIGASMALLLCGLALRRLSKAIKTRFDALYKAIRHDQIVLTRFLRDEIRKDKLKEADN